METKGFFFFFFPLKRNNQIIGNKIKRIEALKEITFDEFANETLRVLGRKNPNRLCILTEGQPPQNAEENTHFTYSSLNLDEIRSKIGKSKL